MGAMKGRLLLKSDNGCPTVRGGISLVKTPFSCLPPSVFLLRVSRCRGRVAEAPPLCMGVWVVVRGVREVRGE